MEIDLNRFSPQASCYEAFCKTCKNFGFLSVHHNLFKHSFFFSFNFVNRIRSRMSFLGVGVQMTADCKEAKEVVHLGKLQNWFNSS